MTELAPAISSFLGILVGSGLVGLWLKGREDRVRVLESEVVELREGQVKALREAVQGHLSQDQSQRFSTQLETVIAQNNEMLLELRKLNRESATQAADIKNNANRLDGVHKALRDHTIDRGIHHA